MSLANGLFGLSQSMGRPAQLSQTQQGLLSGFGEALNPRPQMNVGDPASMRAAAQHAMQRGDTLEGQQLMKQAQDAEQRITEGKIANIKRTYAQAEAAGKGEQFKATMVEAGEADTIAQIEQERLDGEVKRVTGQAVLNSAEGKEITQKYMSAQTPEGKQAVIDAAMATGRGDVIKEVIRKEAQANYDQSLLASKESQLKDVEAQKKIDSFPVPDTVAGIQKQAEAVPAEYRDYYMERARTVTQARKTISESLQDDTIKTKDLSESSDILEMAGWDKAKYKTIADAFGTEAANRAVKQAGLEKPKVAKPTQASGDLIKNMTKSVEHELTKLGVDAGFLNWWNKSAEEMGNVELLGTEAAYLVAGGMEPSKAVQSVIANRDNASTQGPASIDVEQSFMTPDGKIDRAAIVKAIKELEENG